jgi:2-polyprenyl-3-methyl-5-hydroxy-6-metoxy-1,4-benzoquinol methylase
MPGRSKHWENVYTTKRENEVSWYQAGPKRSLALITEAAPDKKTAIIDVGGGASTLVRDLSGAGYSDVAVLDISAAALDRAKANLGEASGKIDWIVTDITQWQPPRRWNVWHDRAVFHFLTSVQDQEAYLRALDAGTAANATVVISTFALDGPEKCSGLPVHRYSAATLAARLGPAFRLVKENDEDHRTPGGGVQKFTYAVFRKFG